MTLKDCRKSERHLFAIEHVDDIVCASLVQEQHLGDDGGLRRDELAATHFTANGSHYALNVGGGCSWRKVAGHNTIGTGGSTDSNFAGVCRERTLLDVEGLGRILL